MVLDGRLGSWVVLGKSVVIFFGDVCCYFDEMIVIMSSSFTAVVIVMVPSCDASSFERYKYMICSF